MTSKNNHSSDEEMPDSEPIEVYKRALENLPNEEREAFTDIMQAATILDIKAKNILPIFSEVFDLDFEYCVEPNYCPNCGEEL